MLQNIVTLKIPHQVTIAARKDAEWAMQQTKNFYYFYHNFYLLSEIVNAPDDCY